MKEFHIESFSSAHKICSTVKTRKDFKCLCCENTFSKGTMAQVYKCVNGCDFFEMKFCENCRDNVDFRIIKSY